MNLEEFYSKIKLAVEENLMDLSQVKSSGHFLRSLNNLMEDNSRDDALKITGMSVLFEGFYQSVKNSTSLKNHLSEIRLKRWENHYGTPTITFLLTYHSQIEKTKCIFELASSDDESSNPWEIINSEHLSTDEQNSVLIDKKSPDRVIMPSEEEKTGQFLITHNPSGGFTTTPCDPVSQKFIEHADQIGAKGGAVLEVGAAFGTASLQALAKGTTTFCNDIDPANLAVLRNRNFKICDSHEFSVTGDNSKLVLVPGACPHELAGLPKDYFDAILICRVLHFLSGEEIEKSLEQFFAMLKPGAKLFIVCETPFLKNWQQFMPEFEKRLIEGVRWPGEITNSAEYESSGRAASLPKFVHWITKEIIEKSLKEKKFEVEYLSYIDRHGQFPEDLLLDGRESIGAIATKPYF